MNIWNWLAKYSSTLNIATYYSMWTVKGDFDCQHTSCSDIHSSFIWKISNLVDAFLPLKKYHPKWQTRKNLSISIFLIIQYILISPVKTEMCTPCIYLSMHTFIFTPKFQGMDTQTFCLLVNYCLRFL